jgi:hypothetical protein
MIRRLKIAAAAVGVVLSSGLVAVGWIGFSEPPVHHLALSQNLIAATSSEGEQLLRATSIKTDYGQLLPYFVSQSRRAYCGVASSTIVINALRRRQPFVSQDSFFTPEVSTVRSAMSVSFTGLTLDQMAALIRAHGLRVRVVHASETDLESFRSTARAVLDEPAEFIIVNYDRVALQQEGGGHISPVGAYHAESDRFLVVDVAAHKYPPTWVSTKELWNAMEAVDPDSGKARGFLLVRNGGA